MDRVTRNEKVLNALEARGALTHDGKEWLIAALDPFHDTSVSPRGWPDVEAGASVVRVLKQSINISKPSIIETPGWNCYIVVWPWQEAPVFVEHSRESPYGNNVMKSDSPPTSSLGGIQVFGSAADAAFDFQVSAIGEIVPNPIFLKGSNRIIAMGYEVVNTTADIYKQGLVTNWRMNLMKRAPSTFTVVDAEKVIIGYPSVQLYEQPPTSINEAMLIPGSRQWRAEDGVYSVCGFVGEENPPELPNYVQPGIVLQGSDVVGSVNHTPIFSPATVSESEGPPALFPAQRLFPFHMNGSFFTGLSDQTTLTLTRVMYIETFPAIQELDVLVMATPSANYDPVALELYSHCVSKLPVAVPVGENPMGEWFAKAVSEAADFLAPIAAAVGGPGLTAAVNGTGAMAKYYLKTLRPPKPQKPKQPAALPPPPMPLPPPPTFGGAPQLSKAALRRRRKALATAKLKGK